MRKLIAVLAVALAAAPAAAAGGWATVGVAPLPPVDGSDWNVTLMVKQHGQTPLDGVEPLITIRHTGTGETRSVAATPTGTPGQYRARVEFPSAGTWAYEVFDGFTQYGGAKTHTFAPVTIAGSAGDGAVPAAAIAAGVVLALALGTLLLLLARRRRPAPGLAATSP